MIIAIDGPAGAGKSTIAAKVAERLSLGYLDTGAMYRAITLAAMRSEICLEDPSALQGLAQECRMKFSWDGHKQRVWLNGEEITAAIRDPQVTAQSQVVAKDPAVREILVDEQRRLAAERGSLVTEGRDQGTVVFPEAQYKFYLDASSEERARRRQHQLGERGIAANFEETLTAMIQRDAGDAGRDVGPLKMADDAIRIDSTGMTIDEVVETVCCYVRECSE